MTMHMIQGYEHELQRLKAELRAVKKEQDERKKSLQIADAEVTRQGERACKAEDELRAVKAERDENRAGWMDAAKLAGELREELRETQKVLDDRFL